MWARALTFLIWALVAASGVHWGLKLFARPTAVPAQAVAVSAVAPTPSMAAVDLGRLMGVDAPPPAAVQAATPAPDARFQLLGVVASRGKGNSGQAVALIAVDGKPAKAYRVGATVTGDTLLRAVHARGVDLGALDGPVQVSLQLAQPAPAAGGVVSPGLPPAFGVRPQPVLPTAAAPIQPQTGAQTTPRSMRVPQMMPPPGPVAQGAVATPAPVDGAEPSPLARRPRPGNEAIR